MKIKNLIILSLCLLTLAGIGVEATRQQPRKDKGKDQGKDPGVMLMNRIAPSSSELYVANADGTNERKLFADSSYDSHASFSQQRPANR